MCFVKESILYVLVVVEKKEFWCRSPLPKAAYADARDHDHFKVGAV